MHFWQDPATLQAGLVTVAAIATAVGAFYRREKALRRTDTQMIGDAADALVGLLGELEKFRAPATPTPAPAPADPARARLANALRAASLGARPDGTQR